MRAVCKVCGLTLLLQVRTLLGCGDNLFLEVPPLASNALLAMLHPLLKNVLQTIDHFKISCLRALFSWLEKPRNCMGWDLDYMADVLMGFHQSTFSKLNIEPLSDVNTWEGVVKTLCLCHLFLCTLILWSQWSCQHHLFYSAKHQRLYKYIFNFKKLHYKN
jgi:hypothetical protein